MALHTAASSLRTGAGVLRTVVRRAAFALLSAVVIVQASAEPFASTTTMPPVCAPAASLDLTVYVINEAGAAQQTLDTARREAARIWATAGLHLAWTSSGVSSEVLDGKTVVVVVRRALPLPAVADARNGAKGRPPLGWVTLRDDGQPGPVIDVSFQGLDTLVMAGPFQGRSLWMRPSGLQQRLLGRALGRVMAHEIGHWLMGREHTRGGLMKPTLGVDDLVNEVFPRLPREWTAAGADLLALSSRCRGDALQSDP